MEKTFLNVTLGLCTAMLFSCCTVMSGGLKPSKNQITRNYNVTSFENINVSTVADVTYTQSTGDSYEVKAYGPENYVALLEVSVAKGTLIIKNKDKTKMNGDSKMRINISSPQLLQFESKGVGDVDLKGTINGESLQIISKGVGDFDAENLQLKHLNVYNSGVGDVELKGQVQTATIESSGVGDVDADELMGKDVTVNSKGVGDVSCHATEHVSITSKGVGDVTYKGNPKIKDLTKKGVGSISGK